MANATSNILKMSQQKEIHICCKLPESYSNPGPNIQALHNKRKTKSFKNREGREQSVYYDYQSPCIWELVDPKVVKFERHYNMS